MTLVVRFEELGAGDVERVGGKCANLGELTGAGFPVPPGFAVTTAAPAAAAGELAAAVADAYRALGEPPVAVRSSAVAEDGAEASFAGVQDTYLWRRGVDEVLDAVRRCWSSLGNPEAVAYRAERGIAETRMAVAVQAMVDARVAGVAFTRNPVSGDPATVAIDASWGLGVSVVGGEVTPDSFLVNKITGAVVRSRVGAKETECLPDPAGGGTATVAVDDERRSLPCLEPEELAALVDMARRVERHYGCHQDVEWAIDRATGELRLLQARPETVWARRPAAPAPAGAMAALTATFTGGLRR
ncbi:MAG TPA: PEP/pyruvate-binding domain-containing protein [Gaiellaceae bacterium]|jgi:pyruvate,water dikinase